MVYAQLVHLVIIVLVIMFNMHVQQEHIKIKQVKQVVYHVMKIVKNVILNSAGWKQRSNHL